MTAPSPGKTTNMPSGLTELETKRASTYGAKLATISEQWRESQQLLVGGIQEIARTERYILGSALVHQARSDAMQAIYNDILLDDELNSVVDENMQETLYEERIKKGFEALLVDETQHPGMLSSLVESQSVVAQKFAEDALMVTSNIAKEMTEFRKELRLQVEEITTRGNAIMEELNSAEELVISTWDAYSSAAAHGGRRKSWIGSSTNTVEQLEKDYGMAVVEQTRVWESNSKKVEEVLDSVITTETDRRAKLQELLRDYVPGQRRLFSSSARIQNKVIEELQNQEDTSQFYPNFDLEEKHGYNDFEARELPLTSNLVAAIKIAERRKANKNWELVVAVVTKDDYLHLFEMPKSSSTSISNPEQVFMELLPTNASLFPPESSIGSDASSSDKQSASDGSAPSPGSEFNPLESWHLPNCSIKRRENDREIEVMARAGGFLSSRRKKRLLLRTDSKEDTSQWIDMLQRKEEASKVNGNGVEGEDKPKDSGFDRRAKVASV